MTLNGTNTHTHTQTHTHSVGHLWKKNRPDAETSTCTTHNTHSREIHPWPGVIRTHKPGRLAAADLRVRPRGHLDRLPFNFPSFLVWSLLPTHCRCRRLPVHWITLTHSHTHSHSVPVTKLHSTVQFFSPFAFSPITSAAPEVSSEIRRTRQKSQVPFVMLRLARNWQSEMCSTMLSSLLYRLKSTPRLVRRTA
jgi:hypothetical protein